MFTPDVQFLDFTAEDWLRLPDLFRAPAAAALDAMTPRATGGIIAVREGQRIVKVTSTVRGRLPPPAAGPATAASLAAEHGGSFVAVLTTSALEQFGDRFARRLSRGQSFLAQIEGFVAALRELEGEGEVELWPSSVTDWPIPTERAFGSALDLVCPDGKSLVLGAFDEGELYTALALRRRGPAFDVVMGPDRVRRDMGLLSGDFSRDYRYLGAAVEARLGPLAVGCYAELETFRRLAREPQPGAWASAVAMRDVLLTPSTPGLAVPLGVDAGRAALSFAKGLVGRIGMFGNLRAPGSLGPRLERAYALVEGDVRRYLGFDPWRVLANWFREQP
ncbi:MAG TPA: hypothetical protein VEQ59_20390 [Polyangiaceae bacterium]|nr:hypothetical protein [Polyangiaceae bacterium]